MTTKAKTVASKVLQFELAMIPAILMSIIDAFRMSWWDVYDLEGRTGGEAVDLFFGIAEEYVAGGIPALVCMAVIIAVIAIVLALRKGKTE
jgi:hypothetical protein